MDDVAVKAAVVGRGGWRGGWGGWVWPGVVCAVVLVATVVAVRWEGRVWYCACAEFALWKGDVWSSHCSQHPFDPYSFTHFSHGLIFASVLGLIAKRWHAGWQLAASLGLAGAWEVAENSEWVINRYRTVTMSLDYLGDSVTNAGFDVVCCGIGFFVAKRLGLWRTAALFVVIEAALLILVRDNLTLNVLMLISPVEGVKVWQMGGRGG